MKSGISDEELNNSFSTDWMMANVIALITACSMSGEKNQKSFLEELPHHHVRQKGNQGSVENCTLLHTCLAFNQLHINQMISKVDKKK